jgi:hypothetical protein
MMTILISLARCLSLSQKPCPRHCEGDKFISHKRESLTKKGLFHIKDKCVITGRMVREYMNKSARIRAAAPYVSVRAISCAEACNNMRRRVCGVTAF